MVGRGFEKRVKSGPTLKFLVDVSDIFNFFLESEAPGVGGGTVFFFFFLKIPRGGGFQEGKGPRGREGGIGEFFWGGPKIIFRGRNVHQECYCWPKAQEKQQKLESRIFMVVAFSPGNTVTKILDNYPPLWGRKNPRIIVGGNSCDFGASQEP